MKSLVEFFAAMEPFLLGERSAEDVLAQLGPSPSGSRRFALYAELVARQRRSVIDHFYRSVAAAAASPALFARLRDDYLRAHPPSHWSPSEAARAFPQFLSSRDDATGPLRALADFAWVRFAAMHAPHEDGSIGLDAALFVRHYDHDVRSFSDEVERLGKTPAQLSATPRTLLVTRHRREGTLVVVTPSLASLVALAAAGGSLSSLPPGLTWSLVIDGAVELEGLGIVPDGTAELVRSRESR